MLIGICSSWISSWIWSFSTYRSFKFWICMLEIHKATYNKGNYYRLNVSNILFSLENFGGCPFFTFYFTYIHFWFFNIYFVVYTFFLFLGSVLFARGLLENPNLFRWPMMLNAFFGLLVLICANAFIVGINQIYDIDIDRYVVLRFLM